MPLPCHRGCRTWWALWCKGDWWWEITPCEVYGNSLLGETTMQVHRNWSKNMPLKQKHIPTGSSEFIWCQGSLWWIVCWAAQMHFRNDELLLQLLGVLLDDGLQLISPLWQLYQLKKTASPNITPLSRGSLHPVTLSASGFLLIYSAYCDIIDTVDKCNILWVLELAPTWINSGQ